MANMCGYSCERLLEKCTNIIVKYDVDVTILDKSFPHISWNESLTDKEVGLTEPEYIDYPGKHVKRIHLIPSFGVC